MKARIAAAVLGRLEPSRRVGKFTLRAEQTDAVRLIRRSLAEFGGALLADPPGTGKTIVALAVAAGYENALVAAPATLRVQWERAAERAGVAIRFVSLESLSRDAVPAIAALVIVDEAHHVRTPSTRRYRRLAERSSGAHLLLLTATPVVNRAADRDALLALFLGERAMALSPSEVARMVIRREAHTAPQPRISELPPLEIAVPDLPIADHLRRLPPPFPASDGREALALVRLSLAMAWASSTAALDAALRRRIQRGESLADLLADGRWPDRATLRQWIVGDDATQLAMPLLLTGVADVPPLAAREMLATHINAVRALRAIVQPAVAADAAARAAALQRLLAQAGRERMVVFCSHARTVQTLFSALRSTQGVVAITGARVTAAHGRWSRADVLRALGPGAAPWRPDDARGVRLVLTTDLLAEGVELQGASIVVHGDVAWTPARFEQRVGRVARIGGCAEIGVTRFLPPAGAEEILELRSRLARKERSRQRAVADPLVTASTRLILEAWRAPTAMHAGCAMAAVRGNADGFLALVRNGRMFQLVGGKAFERGWRITDSPREVATLVRAAAGIELPLRENDVRAIRRALHRWCHAAEGADAVGLAHGNERTLRRAVRRRLDAALRSTPLTARSATAARWGTALDAALAVPGAGTSQAFARLLRTRPEPVAFAESLEALSALRHQEAARTRKRLKSKPRLAALLRIVPHEVPEPVQDPPRPSGKATRSRSVISLA